MGSITRNIFVSSLYLNMKMFMPLMVPNIRNVRDKCHFRCPHVIHINTFTTTVKINFKFQYPPSTHRDIKRNIPKVQDGNMANHLKSEHLPTSRAIKRNTPSIPLHDDTKSLKSQVSNIKSTYPRKNFSPVEDSLIIAYVKKFGDTNTTFKALCEHLDRKHYRIIKLRHKRLIEDANSLLLSQFPRQSSAKYTFFTKEEDEIILKYISDNGDHIEAYKVLSKQLNRKYWSVIRDRHRRLTIPYNSLEKPIRQNPPNRKMFSLEEDRQLMKCVFKVMNYQLGTFSFLKYWFKYILLLDG